MSQFHKLTIKEVKKITPKAVTVLFDVPDTLKDKFQFEAGQYVTVKKEIGGKELRRDYSICSSPLSGQIKVGIKKVEGGTFSVYANDDLKVGDILEVHEPNGRFTFIPNKSISRNIAAFAAGSGITPVISIMKTVLKEEPESNFVLIYGNKTITDSMFHDEILELKLKYPGRLSVYFVYSRTQEENSIFGRIEKSTVNFVIKNKHKNIDFDSFYLCGPEAMIKTVSEALKDTGVSNSKIHFELFTYTSPVENVIPDAVPEGKTKIKVLLDDEETEFIMDKKTRVLDAVLKHNLDAPYSCQGGICSSCIAKLKEGEVKMVKNQILTDGEIEEGFILTCQSHPVTDSVFIDYDDV
ncbi:ferredoxin--NADP reductase [Abyssalbus ytuae]|uniref:Ferredoxin--NADP reductase n=1 Tax=Abyssalbus ytuae TaxID=2926907 RepID=A0A9E6ZQE8_9FLAO|nr:ferredoxin--NADP reductase [Abyssalbus ytuae]UOB16003.1 ferredoxin--NADP reductase [Abyssalbus ytuae]